MLEIYMQDMLEGYVDEMIALGGYGKIGYEHFSIDLLRKTVNLSDSYLPLRQKRLIAFDLNWVFYSVCNIIWPLLPNEIKERIKLFQNKEELKDYLKGIMDLNILPEDVLRG